MKNQYILSKHGEAERPALMWFWSDKLTPEMVVYQIEKFKEAGIEEFYIHSGHGDMGFPYLSDEFNALIRLASDTAERLGMKYSIYDEFAWSSGTCAGRIMDEYPEYRMTNFRWYEYNAIVGDTVEIWFKGNVLAVQAVYADREQRREDITDRVTIEYFGDGMDGRVTWKNDRLISARVFVFCRCNLDGLSMTSVWGKYSTYSRGFTDVMNPAAVRKFLEINNEVYKKTIGDKFGKNTCRIFTDETSYSDFGSPTSSPYSDLLEEEFRKEHGYALRDHYISLTEAYHTDEDLKVRYHYYKTLTRMFCTAYLDQYKQWCHENGLLLTGHMSGGGLLYYQTMQHGDFYEALSRFDIPGMDSILSKLRLKQQNNWSGYKLVSSVAKFNNQKKILCETFSGSGWDLSLEDAKYIMNKLRLQGITYTIYMGAFYSMNTGSSKNFPCGYPPSHGFQNPLFRHYHALSDHAAVRASLMTQTTPVGSTLILQPQINSWVDRLNSAHESSLDRAWALCSHTMQYTHNEYDFYFEALGPEVKVADATIDVRGFRYNTMIVPHVAYSNQVNLDMLEEFAKQGGRLVFLNKFPELAVDTGKRYDFAEICGLSEEGKNFFASNKDYAVHQEGNILLISTGFINEYPLFNFPYDRIFKDLGGFVRAATPDEPISVVEMPENVFVARREAEGLYSCFVENETPDPKTVKLRINREGKVTVLEGTVLKEYPVVDGIVTLEVPGYEMPAVLLTASDCEVTGLDVVKESAVPAGEIKAVELDSGWTFETGKNNVLPLRLKYFAAKEPDGTLSEELQQLAQTVTVPYACHEFPSVPGCDYGSGYAAFARFEIREMPEKLELFNEVDGEGELWLNGRRLTEFTKVIEYGPHDSVTDITPYVKTGTNILVMVNRIPEWKCPHKMPCTEVRGAFCVAEDDVIVAPKNEIDPAKLYTVQGWQYYGGEVFYRSSFNLDKQPASVRIKLETREVAEVIVNGKSAGMLYWNPYELDITEFCRSGENTVEIKISTTLEPTMVIEEIRLVSQGFAEYSDEVGPRTVGLLSAPVLTVIS